MCNYKFTYYDHLILDRFYIKISRIIVFNKYQKINNSVFFNKYRIINFLVFYVTIFGAVKDLHKL